MTAARLVSSWVNGEPQDTLSVADRGLQYGDGFFTTGVTYQHRLLNANAHWHRLTHSAQRLGFGTLGEPRLKMWVDEAMREYPKHLPRVIKILVTRGSGGRGYAPPPAQVQKPTYLIQNLPYPSQQNTEQDWGFWQNTETISVAVLNFQWGQNRALAGLKHLNRLENVLAHQALQALSAETADVSFQEGIVSDDAGHLISGIQSNLVLKWRGQWWTPKLECCGVQGTTLTTLQQLDFTQPIQPTHLTLSQLAEAEAVFLCNAVRGIMPVSHLWLSPRQVKTFANIEAEVAPWQRRWREWVLSEVERR